MKFDFDDILLEPAVYSQIDSRKDINLFYDDMLPLFTAPMDTVVNIFNYKTFNDNNIHAILSRKEKGIVYTSRKMWISIGLDDFINKYIYATPNTVAPHYILIDIANGHMEKLLLNVKKAKFKYNNDLILMVGNIANPKTYIELSNAGADYIRVGIGNGGGCLTTQQTGIGYPMASLINEVYKYSYDIETPAKIVADGGFKKYSDIIKALALGADYVMLGSIFNKSLESCGKNVVDLDTKGYCDFIEYNVSARYDGYLEKDATNKHLNELMKNGKLYKQFRGMSTKEAQLDLGSTELKTSEGVVKYQKVEYTLNGWVSNFKHYLSSAMSYTGHNDIKDFIGSPKFNQITINSFNRYNK